MQESGRKLPFPSVSAPIVLQSRSIRLAVNLCVIGALLLPNGGLRAASGSNCHEVASSTACCEGCGHCSVEQLGTRCGCCSTQRKGCCHSHGAKDSTDREPRKEDKGICLCNPSPLPTAPAPTSRTSVEQLVHLLTTTADRFVRTEEASARSTGDPSAPSSLLPLNTQRQLCVWRI